MKKVIFILLLLFVVISIKAQTLLLEENFNFSGKLTDNGWTSHSGAGTNPVSTTDGLSYSGYLSSGIGNAASLVNTGEDVNKTFTTQSSGVLYISFLAKIDANASGYFFHLSTNPINTSFYRGRLWVGSDGTGDFEFGLSYGSNTPTYTNNNYSFGTTYLIVLKYEFIAGAQNDKVSLFVIIGAIPTTEPVTATLGPITEALDDAAGIGSIALRQYLSSQRQIVDGIRVQDYWGFSGSNPLVADFTSDVDSGAKPLTVNFTDQTTGGTPPYTYAWDFGDGSTSEYQNPSHQYDSVGSFTVRLIITDDISYKDTMTKVDFIKVSPQDTALEANFTADVTSGYDSLIVTFTDLTTGGKPPYTYDWDFGDGNTSSLQNPVHKYNSLGTYSVRLIVTDNLSEKDTLLRSNYISVTPQPTIVDNPQNFSATSKGKTIIGLEWKKNSSGDSVMIAYRTSNSFGIPVKNKYYSINDTLGAGGQIIYIGIDTLFLHSSLDPGKTYYYEIWSYNSSRIYSTGLTAGATTQSDYTGYYAGLDGLTGQPLKDALHNIIKGHTVIPYGSTDEAMMVLDEDTTNSSNVMLVYCGRSYAKSNFGGGVDQWNREHLFAKSHGVFDDGDTPGSDLFNLRPCDVSVNSDRGNKDFDNGGTQHSEAIQCYYTSDTWEPRDADKGDIARSLFYMAVRYEVEDGWDLELTNTVPSSAPFHGKFSTLVQWHEQDPVDDYERQRNEKIYTNYQHNRNPFIDHPEFVQKIWFSADTGVVAPQMFLAHPKSMNSMDLMWYPNPNSDVVIIAYNTSDVFGNPVNGQTYNVTDVIPGGGTVCYVGTDTNFIHTGLNPNTLYYYKIWSKNSVNIYSTALSSSARTTLDTYILEFTNFTYGTFEGWTQYSVTSNRNWIIKESSVNPGVRNKFYVDMNGYGADVASDDWFISPQLNLSFDSVYFNYYTQSGYSGPDLNVKASTNYSGGNPTTATWDLLATHSATGSWTLWINRNVSLTNYANQPNVHVAFQYISTGTTSGTAATWRVDELEIGGLDLVGVCEKENVPTEYTLSQNYPNPFNPTTVISYQLPIAGFVSLKVYDVLGREVATLVNKEQNAGNYKVEFNANNLSSGIYFYRMEAGDFVSVQKMILMK